MPRKKIHSICENSIAHSKKTVPTSYLSHVVAHLCHTAIREASVSTYSVHVTHRGVTQSVLPCSFVFPRTCYRGLGAIVETKLKVPSFLFLYFKTDEEVGCGGVHADELWNVVVIKVEFPYHQCSQHQAVCQAKQRRVVFDTVVILRVSPLSSTVQPPTSSPLNLLACTLYDAYMLIWFH